MADAESRRKGLEKMEEVYGFSVEPDEFDGDYVAFTVDHLFGSVWTREGLDTAQRRLLTMGVLAAHGEADLLELQFVRALETGELDPDQLNEVVLHLTHYIGWPRSTRMELVARQAIDRHLDRVGTSDPEGPPAQGPEPPEGGIGPGAALRTDPGPVELDPEMLAIESEVEAIESQGVGLAASASAFAGDGGSAGSVRAGGEGVPLPESPGLGEPDDLSR